MSSDEAFRGSKVVILDFGSQYTQVIARRVRESRVYSEILPFKAGPDLIRETGARGIILSGGPAVSLPKVHRRSILKYLPWEFRFSGFVTGCS